MSQILIRVQLKKEAIDENIISSFLALQGNLLLQQTDLLNRTKNNKKTVRHNIQIWFTGEEKRRVVKSSYGFIKYLKSFTRGVQKYKQ